MQNVAQESGSSQTLWWNEPIVYWQANQVAITFHSPVDRSQGVERVIASLNLDILEQFLATHSFHLTSFTTKDVPHPEEPPPEELEQLEEELEQLEAEVEALERLSYQQASASLLQSDDGRPNKTPGQRVLEELEARIEELERAIEERGGNASHLHSTITEKGPNRPAHNLNSPLGKYLYAPISGQGTLAVCFFHSTNTSLALASSSYGHSKTGPTAPDSTHAIVTLLNQNLDKLKQYGNIPIVASMPNWMGGGTPITMNCPAAPPVPVTGKDTAYSNWHFTLPQLSPTLQEQDADGVTVFVLDTIPTTKLIRNAALSSGTHNILLQNIMNAMDSTSPSFVVDHQRLPKRLGENIQAGKDLVGTLYGFKMFDHGLFVAGIIHDLVPDAKIECVRVLNDCGVGDTAVLCDALQKIQERIAQGTLAGPVVINLSLEFSPSDSNLPGIWFSNDSSCFSAQNLATVIEEIGLLRLGLRQVIQSLNSQGAIIVASSGNESNTNNHPPQRFGPRYPAAFPEVISVGAVDKDRKATTYSDYPSLPPQHNGIATYGGAIPHPLPAGQPHEPPGAKTWADVGDAVVGVYSSHHYPMLLATDEPPGEYPALSSSHCWAYWSGTSFATPIISALAARVLKARSAGLLPTSMSVEDMITTAPGQQLLTATGSALPNTTAFGVGVGMLQAKQVGL